MFKDWRIDCMAAEESDGAKGKQEAKLLNLIVL